MAPADYSSLAPEQLFDLMADKYSHAYGHNTSLNRTLDSLTGYLDPGASVLDVGCGPGGPAAHLASLGFQVTGIDISKNMIDQCRKKNIPAMFHQVDMRSFEPHESLDGVVSLFSLLQVPYRDVCSMIYSMASWLRPGGVLVIGTVPADGILDDAALQGMTGDYIEDHEVDFMGGVCRATLVTTTGLLGIVQQAGLLILNVKREELEVKGVPASGTESQIFITARRTWLEPLFGPWPLPLQRRPAHLLSQGGWEPFASRLTRHEFDAVLKALESNKRVLDVGSGHGELPVLIAKQLGKAFAIEPNAERNDIISQKGRESNVEITQGTAESLPYGDKSFDALVALWILHYVDDLEAALTEMVRVVDPAAPNARLIIIQGAPDNDLVDLLNRVCIPIAAGEGAPRDHQGLLLATAARVFSRHGFGDITLSRVLATCDFPEEDVSERCDRAAEVLTDFWYAGHPRAEEMRRSFGPALREHFGRGAREVKDQAVMLVARPTNPKRVQNYWY
ncbi:putative methyltransferase [Escovopsis weberi]|uniref:Putative methyltransferase n=1 Tax=Escovopsis weberi TaxID=150374 RepID=A0A0M8N7Q2_ESCWE|nr:putative methyltransferase [Escovopsis weberi]